MRYRDKYKILIVIFIICVAGFIFFLYNEGYLTNYLGKGSPSIPCKSDFDEELRILKEQHPSDTIVEIVETKKFESLEEAKSYMEKWNHLYNLDDDLKKVEQISGSLIVITSKIEYSLMDYGRITQIFFGICDGEDAIFLG